MASKPTIVLIPGACTEASCFDRLRACLKDAGYESVAVSHPSANPADPFAHTAETMGLNVQENYVQPGFRLLFRWHGNWHQWPFLGVV
jgi:hypothetical protein